MIFDDDPSVGALVSDVCRGRGYSVEHHMSAAGIVEIVRQTQPRLVVLDIMMPGLDGVSACHAIRSHVATRRVKIVMLSSKTSNVDQEAARRAGADLYLTKPFSVEAFARAVVALLGAEAAPVPAAPAAPVSATLFPGGGVVETDGVWLVLDAGAGVGSWIGRQRRAPGEAWMFFSRYDAATTQEIDGAAILLGVGTRLRLAGPDSPDAPLQRLAPRVTRAAGLTRSLPLLQIMREGDQPLWAGASATGFYGLYPGLSMGYRFDLSDRRIVYCPAHVPNPDPAARESHDARKFRGFFKDAHLLVHGFGRARADLGESAAWEAVQDLAASAGARRLALLPLPGTLVPPDLGARAAERGRGAGVETTLVADESSFVL